MATISENRKAYFNYEISETFEAGLVLAGHEVKSIKLGRMSLLGSYVVFRGEELYLVNADVPPYQPKNTPADYNSKRDRKLLLNKSEIHYLIGKSKQRSLTMIPLKVYTKGGKIKLGFGLGKGRKGHGKRELLKKRASDREIRRELKARG